MKSRNKMPSSMIAPPVLTESFMDSSALKAPTTMPMMMLPTVACQASASRAEAEWRRGKWTTGYTML
jgi:hypothetical protein